MSGQAPPVIASRASLQAVFDDTPEVMRRLLAIADRLQAVLDGQNLAAIRQILSATSDLTTILDQRSQDAARLIADGSTTLHNMAAASARLNALLEHTSGQADSLMTSANVTLNRATKLAVDLDSVVRASRPGLNELTTVVPARLDSLLAQASRLTASLDRVSTELERDPSRLLFGVRQEGYRPR